MLSLMLGVAQVLMGASNALSDGKAIAAGPDGKLVVEITIEPSIGKPMYAITYDGKTVLEPSALGLVSTDADYSKDMAIISAVVEPVSKKYSQNHIKRSKIEFIANQMIVGLGDSSGRHVMDVEFMVANNDVAFRYVLPKVGEPSGIRVMDETTSFTFPAYTTTFLSPQSDPMIGWKRTKPSYEEEYRLDRPMSECSRYGRGYTFPALFKVGNDRWALISETGVDSRYCASRLGDFDGHSYKIEFPMAEENNGNGTREPAFSLPGATPWRTLSIGASLAPIVESTIYWDVLEPLYEPTTDYAGGRGTWSWIVWQDASINFDDIVKYIDFAAEMGYEYTLIDNYWDNNIGAERMAQLIAYAHGKGVEPLLWYSSSGYWNDIEQGPVNRMDNPIVRKKEMKWLRDNGVKGIKVDFFGGDKQETMRLYESILSDANDFGLMVIFHGCTLPRGWERMYPNYVGSEAVLASENIYFQQHFCDVEAVNAATHPFIRNAVGCMEFGGTFLNRRLGRDNNSGNVRRTSDLFQIATAVLFQNPVQNFALTPNNLTDAPSLCIDFMKQVPTHWDETRFIDGYPGKYVVLARRSGNVWYVAGVNATAEPLSIKLDLSMLEGTDATLYYDVYASKAVRKRLAKGEQSTADDFVTKVRSVKVAALTHVDILPNSGVIIVVR